MARCNGLRACAWVLVSALSSACSTTATGHRTTKSRAAEAQQRPVTPLLAEDVISASVPLMPHAVTSFGAAALGDAVYALGGYSGTPHAYSREGQSGDLWRLSLRDGSWSKLAPTEPVQGSPLVSLGAWLMRAGGMRALNSANEREHILSLNEAALYDPASDRWSALPAMPQPRSSHALVALDDKIYVVGGWMLGGQRESGTFAEHGLVFDRTTQTWELMPQPFRLRALAAAALDGHVVVLGGIDEEGKTSRAVHAYDPINQRWTRLADLPGEGFGIAATSNGDVLYASSRDGVLYSLASVGGAFREEKRLFFPRFFHQLVMPDAQRVIALGGISGMHFGSRIRTVETLDVGRSEPSLITFTLQNPLRGRNRQGIFAALGSLYVFGGNRSLNQHDFAPEDFVADAGRLDLSGLIWLHIPSYPKARQTVQTQPLNSHVLALGGFGHDGKEARAQADAYLFDLESEEWSEAKNQLKTPRTQFGLTEFQNTLWIFGGLNYDPARGKDQFEHPTSVLRADQNEPFAEAGVSLPRPRRAFGGARLEDRYYLVGGMAEGFAPVTQCDVFVFQSQTFEQIPCPAPRISPQLVASRGKLYLAGGSSPTGQGLTENPSLEVFDPTTKQWSTLLETLPIPPHNLSMLELNGNLLLYSAHNEEGVVRLALIRVP